MDRLNVAYIAMINGWVAVNSTTTTAVRVGSSNLRDRKWLCIQAAPGGTTKIFVGSESVETTACSAAEIQKSGIKMADGDILWLPVSDVITVYACSCSGSGKRIRVLELA